MDKEKVDIKDFTLVLPVLNESQNLKRLLREIRNILYLNDLNILVIDDNSDDKFESEKITKNYGAKYFLRYSKNTLSGSIIDSISKINTKYLIVMDSDLQHDPNNIFEMIKYVNSENSDLVIGYRDIKKISFNFTYKRILISTLGIHIANSVLHKKFKDPLTGFFLINRFFLNKISHKLHYGGSKILFNILIFSSKIKVSELLINFRPRIHHSSKFKINWFYHFLKVFFIGFLYRLSKLLRK